MSANNIRIEVLVTAEVDPGLHDALSPLSKRHRAQRLRVLAAAGLYVERGQVAMIETRLACSPTAPEIRAPSERPAPSGEDLPLEDLQRLFR